MSDCACMDSDFSETENPSSDEVGNESGEAVHASIESSEDLYETSRSARDARALWLEEEFAQRLGERLGSK